MPELFCWKCGANLKSVPQPFGRRAECLACAAELHVCRMCRHYDPGKAKQCREPVADPPGEKTRANFCDWFQPGGGEQSAASSPAADARKALDDLFG
jgi:hypothetical protein